MNSDHNVTVNGSFAFFPYFCLLLRFSGPTASSVFIITFSVEDQSLTQQGQLFTSSYLQLSYLPALWCNISIKSL